MKLSKPDWFLVIFVLVISGSFFYFFTDKMLDIYLILIIVLFGFLTGITKKLLIRNKKE